MGVGNSLVKMFSSINFHTKHIIVYFCDGEIDNGEACRFLISFDSLMVIDMVP